MTEKKTLKKYRANVSTEQLADGPALMSTDLFLQLVKNGEVFTVQRKEQRRCELCVGFGRITDDLRGPGFRDPDGKRNCPDCAASGKNPWDVTYRVAW